MLCILMLVACLGYSSAIVCVPELCQHSGTEAPLNCAGSVIKHGGFCGCTDACAKVEGEMCQVTYMFGMIPAGRCDDGLECVRPAAEHFMLGRGRCQKKQAAPRSMDARPHAQTPCEQKKAIMQISFVIYKGQWDPNCDAEGNFLPEQCDNEQKCFCVEAKTGSLLTERQPGPMDCSGVTGVATQVVSRFMTGEKSTPCQQLHIRQSLPAIIFAGQWFANCDTNGDFVPEQCDNQNKCFCVDNTGTILTGRQLGGMHCSGAAPVDKQVVSRFMTGEKSTACQQLHIRQSLPTIIFAGQWFANCDSNGDFVPEQCDNQHKCFCVDNTGTILTGRQLGGMDCSGAAPVDKQVVSRFMTGEKSTACQQLHIRQSLPTIIFAGQWFANCDSNGDFVPEQCDNQHKCFCVDNTGTILTGRQLGGMDCSGAAPVDKQVVSRFLDVHNYPTKCQQLRMSQMLPDIIFAGQWFAKCDPHGDFVPEQCDNQKKCFCVDNTGTILTGRQLGGMDCSSAAGTTEPILFS